MNVLLLQGELRKTWPDVRVAIQHRADDIESLLICYWPETKEVIAKKAFVSVDDDVPQEMVATLAREMIEGERVYGHATIPATG